VLSDVISFEDVFIAGIGFDIAGAVLLAKGLLLSAFQIWNVSAPRLDYSAPAIVARVEDKVSTYVGVVALVLGFFCQLLGYVLELATRSPSGAAAGRGWPLAFVIAGFAVSLVALIYRGLRPSLRKRFLLEVAHYAPSGKKRAHPYGPLLMSFGAEIGSPVRDGEAEDDYAKRVWKVDNFTRGDPE